MQMDLSNRKVNDAIAGCDFEIYLTIHI